MTKILMMSAAAASLACFSAPADAGSAPLLQGSERPGPADPDLAPVETSPQVAPEQGAIRSVADAAALDDGSSSATPPRPAANHRTQARLDPAKKPVRTGARSRKAAPPAKKEAAAGEMVGVVLLTSRVTGPDGRAVARRTVALAESTRAQALVDKGWARAATEAETDTATVVLGD